VEEMMSWWKAKKKRRLEAEFRRNTIRLHEGSKKTRDRKINQKSWHEDVECPKTILFLETKVLVGVFPLPQNFQKRQKFETNIRFSIFEALDFTKLFSNFHRNRLFPHYILTKF
jgi:hypothetical protein